MTHEDLRKAAVKWLCNTNHCAVVISEMVSAAWECPDAVGWKSTHSILVECKVSRADFFRNAQKNTLINDRGVGHERYFLTPEGLVDAEDMRSYAGYGLLHWGEGRIRVVIRAEQRETNEASEIRMLVSALRRVKTREFLTINNCECGAAKE